MLPCPALPQQEKSQPAIGDSLHYCSTWKGRQQPAMSFSRGSVTTTTGAGQAAQSSSSKDAPKTLEEKGKEMMKKKKEEKDPGMSHTTMVLESLRSQGNPQASAHAGSWEERKKVQQKQNLDKISTEISRTAVGIAPLPVC